MTNDFCRKLQTEESVPASSDSVTDSFSKGFQSKLAPVLVVPG